VFGVSEFVIGNMGYTKDKMFESLSVTAEKWIPITEVGIMGETENLSFETHIFRCLRTS
jgi:hypothetical protein